MPLDRRLMQLRDVFAMREHNGWAHYLTHRAARFSGPGKRFVQTFHDRLSEHTDMRSAAFDAKHGTSNQDFFREMMNAIQVPLSPYSFIDVGAGKGAALMLASEFPFRRYVGVDINQDMVEAGRVNVAAFNERSGRKLEPEWVRADF